MPEWRGQGARRRVIYAFEFADSALAVFRLAYWSGDDKKAELYLWTEGPVRPALAESLSLAGSIGIETVSVYAYGDVEREVLELGGTLQDEPARVFVHRSGSGK